MSNKISNVTKCDIFNLFIKGMDVELLLGGIIGIRIY
jgi:hypothetical protein